VGQDFSFDVVCKTDLQAVDNAVNSALREIGTRFDLKGSLCRIDLDRKENTLVFLADDAVKLRNIVDILQGRLVKQGVPLRSLEFKEPEPAEGGALRRKAAIAQGIPSDKGKEMIRAVKDAKLKVTPSLQGDVVRVSGRSKDDLQEAMALLRARDFGVPLQFMNYR
jgi:uncharacterized protein YajQ (UPF0234 family)